MRESAARARARGADAGLGPRRAGRGRDVELELDDLVAPRAQRVRRRVDPAADRRASSGLAGRHRRRASPAHFREPSPGRGDVMTMRTLLKLGVMLGSTAVLYRLLLRRPILNRGATDAEAHARLPGDELLEDANGVATRAITIAAPAAAVWPWIAQMGPSPRGGAYTYDWIENLLGLDMHSADRVLLEYQHPQVGDTLGYGKNRMRFERVEPQRVLATRSEDGNWVWTFVLDQ